MIYGFDTADESAAAGALLVYAIYRSRNRRRYRITPDLWGQIERFTKDAAKRARTLPQFVEALKPRLSCETIHPRWTAIGETAESPMLLYVDKETGKFSHAIQRGVSEQREFLTRLFERANAAAVIARLSQESAWIILLVRDRLEREKPIEQELEQLDEEEADAT